MIYAILDGKYKIDGFDPDEVLSITFAEAEFRNIVTRGGTLSNQVKLAKTGNNQRTLGLLDDVKATTLQAYKLFEADLYIDSLKVFSGNMQILESNDFYNVRFFSSSAGFFSLIKGRKLNTLDLSSYNHTWTSANVNSRRQETSGVVYPNINYGKWTDQNYADKNHTAFFPSVYINTLFSTIATELGYTYTDLTSFTKVLPFSKKEFTRNLSLIGEVKNASDQLLTLTGDITNSYLELATETRNDLDQFVQVSATNDYTTLNIVGKGSFEIEVYLGYSTPATNSLNAVVQVIDGSVNILANLSVAPNVTGTEKIVLTVKNPLTSTSRAIRIQTTIDDINIDTTSYFKILDADVTIQTTDIIPIQDTLPDLTITDLFQHIAVTENAIISVDNQAKTIKFERFDKIANRYPTANNFSKKVANEDNVRTIYHLNEYGQSNYLDYKVASEDDPSSTPEANGRGTITISDTSLDIDKKLYEAPFFRSGLFTGLKTKAPMILVPRYSEASLNYDEPDIEPGVRILDIAVDTTLIVNIGSVAAVTPQANVTFVDFAQDVTDHYSTFFTALNNLKVIEVDLNLTAQDISEVSFNKPVFLLDSYWYVMKIKQFEVNQASPTTFRLLRLF